MREPTTLLPEQTQEKGREDHGHSRFLTVATQKQHGNEANGQGGDQLVKVVQIIGFEVPLSREAVAEVADVLSKCLHVSRRGNGRRGNITYVVVGKDFIRRCWVHCMKYIYNRIRSDQSTVGSTFGEHFPYLKHLFQHVSKEPEIHRDVLDGIQSHHTPYCRR